MRVEEPETGVFDHDADGITELDNQLPRWWLWLFILTVVWSVGYLFYYDIARIGASSRAAYRAEMAAAGQALPTAADLGPVEPSSETAVLAAGQMLFVRNCVSCHGPQGGGLIGPNLCDDTFIHGPTYADLVRVVREGVPARGMIAWRTVLKPHEIQAVASYTWLLRGTTPAKAKAPEGQRHPFEPDPQPTAAPAETL